MASGLERMAGVVSMTRKWLLLSLLETAGERGVTIGEIMGAGVGSRYGARLLELREQGYVVEAKREREGSFRYTLLATPDDLVDPPSETVASINRAATSVALARDTDKLFEVGESQSSHYDIEAA
jgi:hypothetical protein